MSENDQSRLQTLLRPLREREQQARQEFLRARRAVQELEAGIGRCHAALAERDAWAREMLAAGRTADLALYRQCVADLGHELAGKRRELEEEARRLQAGRGQLVQRMKERKAIEQLLRRRQAEAASAALRKETAAQDHLHAAGAAWRAQTNAQLQPIGQDHDEN